MIPRGLRNNNPGNLIKSSVPWVGKIAGADDRFETFDTPFHGIAALCKQLVINQDQHSITTTAGQISRWAPPVENDTAAYIATVAKSLGRGPNDPIDMHNIVMLVALAKAIIQVENGQQPYADELILGAARDALGTRATSPTPAPTQPPPGQPIKRHMDPLTLISVFGPIVAQLIPQVSKIFGGGDQAQKNVALAQTVLDTVVKASGQPNVQGAVEAMQSDPGLTAQVTDAVLTEPAIAAVLEVGGGIQAARAADVAATQAEKPFWFSPAFWISLVLLALPFMLLADVFYVHPGAAYYSENIRTQIVTAVLAVIMIVGGYYLGSSAGSAKKDATIDRAVK